MGSTFYTFLCFAVSDDFGFGVLDAKALTDGAKQWTNVGPQMKCILSFTENTKYAAISFIIVF